jgi:hypothetical protein
MRTSQSLSAPRIGKYTLGFFDILGFASRVRSVALPDLAGDYERLLAHAEAFIRPHSFDVPQESLFPGHPPNAPYCDKYVFSDSIILISRGEDSQSALKLMIYSWRLFQQFLAAGSPLRGAITHGDLYVNRTSGVFLGMALTSAYELEQSQDWVGASIDSSVWEAYPDLSDDVQAPMSLLGTLFPEYDVPLKSALTKRLRALNWRFNLIVLNGTRSLFPEAQQEEALGKQTNTLDFARWVRSSRLAYAQNTPPVETRTFFVGDSKHKPPFDHGDDL